MTDFADPCELIVWTEGCRDGHAVCIGAHDTMLAVGSRLERLQVIGHEWFVAYEDDDGPFWEDDFRGERCARVPRAADLVAGAWSPEPHTHAGLYLAVLADAVARATGQDDRPAIAWHVDDPDYDAMVMRVMGVLL